MPHTNLRPSDATNEGSRRIRELLRRTSYGAIARKLRVDERAVRLWAREERVPNAIMRERWRDVYAWEPDIWDAPPARDSYVGSEPTTTKRV